VFAALLLVAACSGGGETEDRSLVVSDSEGVVVLSETGEVIARLGVVEEGSLAFQPTWSPDGTAVVYTELTGDTATLVITELDGEAVRLPRETFPYYFSWDPDGSRFVTLRNADAAGGILVESVARDGTTEEIDTGAPYYFDWDPAGGRYLAHVGSDRLAIVEPGLEPDAFDFAAGSFQAPAWSDEGQVYLRQSAAGHTLAVDGGEGPRDVAQVVGAAQFVASGGRVAIQSFAATGDGNGVEARLQTLPRVMPRAVHIVDLDAGVVTEIVDHNVIAFFWSPDGERLLIFDTPEAGTAGWRVWDGDTIVDYPPFRPEPEWVASFLPFFDQYTTSMSLWDDAGTAFAYPGNHDGDSGIWLQHLGDAEPSRLSDGTWVAWRPTP
jgi:hypothetical protein